MSVQSLRWPLLMVFLCSTMLSARELVDVQGMVCFKSPTDSRWCLSRAGHEFHEGDRLRSQPRGANAARIVYADGGALVLGPDSMVEFGKDHQIRLLKGEVELHPKTEFALLPGNQTVAERSVWRATENEGKLSLAKLANEPLWLAGFKKVNSAETMGSLLAKVDGRDVPLTVGYHHVTVEIRDQIARTTIEQSFVNHTLGNTEGVFYFPLPQEASIAGFGMWIDDEYVEADVVEKQRAREIYETILRERRDPALLEWTGGNLFKARVFPIFPYSEKRVKIVYTEVLPLNRDGEFQYRYALRSELMRQNPVRDLKVAVKVYAESGVESAICSSHPDMARVDITDKAAHIQLVEQEYTPQSDFEISVKPKQAASLATLIPHQRGEDGYFLASIKLPDLRDADAPARSPDEPLSLVFLADTSGSMTDAQRDSQSQMIEALLSQLGEQDRFQLAVCDVDCLWWRDQPQPVTDESIADALSFLENRVSLGWSDLQRTFATINDRELASNTQIIYFGDGVPATAQTDPNQCAKSLQNIFRANAFQLAFHSVAVGSTFEPITMKAIASLGAGGSFRQISDSAVDTAQKLMADLLEPGYRQCRVQFEGIRTARVYPQTFNHLSPGEQIFVVGRYLPGKAQNGSIVVSAVSQQGPVEWREAITVPQLTQDKGGDTGNSFIPRLWARRYLDELLEQGATEVIQDEIISLSEEYKIMTPYTSFLVLESDEDRERFAVKRRFQMRDGERFFTDGREAANFELVQQQMKRASMWRQNWQRKVRADLKGMGRKQSFRYGLDQTRSIPGLPMSANAGGLAWGKPGSASVGFSNSQAFYSGIDVGSRFGSTFLSAGNISVDVGGSLYASTDEFLMGGQISVGYDTDYIFRGIRLDGNAMTKDHVIRRELPLLPVTSFESRSVFPVYNSAARRSMHEVERHRLNYYDVARDNTRSSFLRQVAQSWELPVPAYYNHHGSLLMVYPQLWSSNPKAVMSKTVWSDDIVELVDSLDREKGFFAAPNHLISIASDFNLVSGELNRTVRSDFVSNGRADDWLHTTGINDELPGTLWNMSFSDVRTVFDEVTDLGRSHPLDEADTGGSGWFRSYVPHIPAHLKSWGAKITPGEKDDTVWLVFSNHGETSHHYLIDKSRHIILQEKTTHEEKDGWSARGFQIHSKLVTTYSDFVDHRGKLYPTVKEVRNSEGQLKTRTELVFSEGDGGLFTRLAGLLEKGMVLKDIPAFLEARGHIKMDKGESEDWMAMIDHASHTQQWDEMEIFLNGLESIQVGNADTMRWLWLHFFQMSRRHELLRLRIEKEVSAVVSAEPPIRPAIKIDQLEKLINYSNSLQPGEKIAIFQLIEPLVATLRDQPEWRSRDQLWRTQKGYALDSWQGASVVERIQYWQELYKDYPLNQEIYRNYSEKLWQSGEYKAALRLLDQRLNNQGVSDVDRVSAVDALASGFETLEEFSEAAELVEPYLASQPFSEYSVTRYLRNLSAGGNEQKADEQIKLWIESYKDSPPAEMTVSMGKLAKAAIGHLTNNRGYVSSIHPRWIPLLTETANECALHSEKMEIAMRILSNGHLRNSDGYRQAQTKLTEFALQQKAEISWRHFSNLCSYIKPGASGWATLREAWLVRWREEGDSQVRTQLGRFIADQRSTLFNSDNDAHQAFLRERIERAPLVEKPDRRFELFSDIISSTTEWNEQTSHELFSLLGQLGVGEAGLRTQVRALHSLTDWIVKVTQNSEASELGSMSVSQQKAYQQSNLESGHRKVVAELAAVIDQARKDPEANSRLPWIELEHLYFQALLPDSDSGKLLQTCVDWLGESPEQWKDIESDFKLVRLRGVLDASLYLASKTGQYEPLLAFVDLGIGLDISEEVEFWRLQKWRLLTAKGDLERLEDSLQKWIAIDVLNPRWRQALGYLFAETDRLPEAIDVFEKLKQQGQLSTTDSVSLAGWLQATGARQEHLESLDNARDQASEQRLAQTVRAIQNRIGYGGNGSVGSLSEADIEAMSELFLRCQAPGNYIYILARIYRHTKDPRIPGCLIPGLLGRSSQEVYPALDGYSRITELIEEESSVDEAMNEIEKLRKGGLAQGAIDQRALDLIEAELKRRAGEVLNQPGQHLKAAIAALDRAMSRKFEPGERLIMAQWLSRYGRASSESLRNAIAAAFTRLNTDEVDPMQRLSITNYWANWKMQNDEYQSAVDLLTIGLNEARSERVGKYTSEMNEALKSLVNGLESLKHFSEAEKVIQTELTRGQNQIAIKYLKQLLFDIYVNALRYDGATSYGTGNSLFLEARKWMLSEIEAAGFTDKDELITSFGELHKQAHGKKFKEASVLWKQFGYQELPPILEPYRNRSGSIALIVLRKFREIMGPEAAIELFIAMVDADPGILDSVAYESVWYRCGYELNRWRSEGKLSGPVADQLFAIFKQRLMTELEHHSRRNIYFCDRGSGWAWNGRMDEFSQVAEDYLERYPDSPAAKENAAKFFYDYPQKRNRACDLLLEVFRQFPDEMPGGELSEYLEDAKRWQDSERVHRQLVERFPHLLKYHLSLTRALFKLNQPAMCKEALEAANQSIDSDRRTESEVSDLADIAAETENHSLAVKWYQEAIVLHRGRDSASGVNSSVISRYYYQIADSHSAMGQDREAVAAASAAIVVWGMSVSERKRSIDRLRQVIRSLEDIDQFAQQLDQEAAKTGLENPIVRKQLGKVYLESLNQPEKAITQLRVAIESQPDDAEIHQLLVRALDKSGNGQAARAQLLESIRLNPRELSLITDLGRRFETVEDQTESERAFTNLVEAMPNEAEGHHALAKVRHQQHRWDEAVYHWDRVAELRSLEPTGLIGKIDALLGSGKTGQAEVVLNQLNDIKWPSRFKKSISQVGQRFKASQ